MNKDEMISSKEQLEQMSTERLDEMLHAELEVDPPDGDMVRQILSVLKERERGQMPENSAQIQAAWENYLRSKNSVRVRPMWSSWFLKAVAVMAVVCMLFSVIPQPVEAEGLFERLIRWTDSYFRLLRADDQEDGPREYVFRTDNPGLQKVYDAVTELGITEPVVPMWLPGDGELTSIRTVNARDVSYVVAGFSDSENGIEYAVLQVSQYLKNSPSEYSKDKSGAETYEAEGIEHHIILNDEKLIVVFTTDNLECCIRIECQEDDLYRMIDSIYMMEVY